MLQGLKNLLKSTRNPCYDKDLPADLFPLIENPDGTVTIRGRPNEDYLREYLIARHDMREMKKKRNAQE